MEVEAVSSSEIHVSWDPSRCGVTGVDYEVTMEMAGSSVTYNCYTGNDTNFTIQWLDSYTEYEICVHYAGWDDDVCDQVFTLPDRKCVDSLHNHSF